MDIAHEIGIFRAVDVVVDTGFTGSLSLPELVIRDLGLRGSVMRQLTLADGQTITTPAYRVRLLWHGSALDVWASMIDNTPMIGTGILAGSRLTVDWWDGGEVVIEERMPPA